MKKKLLMLPFLVGGILLAQISVGIEIGTPPPPRILSVRPVAPGPGFIWVEGYWYPVGHHWKWHNGYWTRPPYPSAVWVVPHHDGRRYYEGYWEGDRGRLGHDHHWDRDRDRDYHHDHDRDHDHDRR